MGNTHGRESRHGAGRGGSYHDATGPDAAAAERERAERTRQLTTALLGTPSSRSRRERPEDAPYERRETKQERDARRLERERVARLKERERSMQEEHVDGGYLVTMGIYTASEDFSKSTVRQLMIDRRIAPFWRGLDDFDNGWAEHQIIAAARGLEIPPADQVPENLKIQPKPADSPGASTQNINKLTVPMGPRTMSAASDKAGSNTPSSVPSPTTASRPAGSPFKPHKKALAAALSLTRNGSQAEIAPREVNLPSDPFVNGQPLEVFLYKEGIECPLCLMYYPPYMNRTRCCDQMICSECFVQIKRPDPHHPEHHGEGNNAQPANQENTEDLIMEPAKCPYCTQTEFGVTYDPPPFRRGLVFAMGPPGLASHSAAMSSTSSLNSSTLSPHSSSPPPTQPNRKRAQSLSANAAGVVTTDRIRPEWTNKLAHARQQQRRRAAAADALHHAAFFQPEQHRTIFGRPSRFARRSTREPLGGSASNSQQPSDGGIDSPAGPDPGPRTSSGRVGLGHDRVDATHLENLMMAEAIRLSLAEEEQRRKKEEKEAKKEAKKREKEERKTAKKGPYQGGGGDGQAASSISIGQGATGSTATGATPASASLSSAAPPAASQSGTTSMSPGAKGKSVDRREETGGASTSGPTSEPQRLRGAGSDGMPERPGGGSHLRQMSSASTVSSTDMDGTPASLQPPTVDDPHSSNMSLEARSDDEDPGQSTEPLFEFRSLAEIVGVPIDGETRSPGSGGGSLKEKSAGSFMEAEEEHVEHVEGPQPETNEMKASDTSLTQPSEAGTAMPGSKAEAKKEDAETTDTVSSKSGSSEHVEVAVNNSKQGDHVISTSEAPSQIS